jgi:hypothetical protein
MEEFLGFGGENSQTSKLAATSSKVFAKTDPQIPYVRGRVVPLTDSRRMEVRGQEQTSIPSHPPQIEIRYVIVFEFQTPIWATNGK